MKDIVFSEYRPGALASLCALQCEHYFREWQFGQAYEAVVSGDMSEFLNRFDPSRDFVQVIIQNGSIEGGIVIDSLDGQLVQLHWFIMSDRLKGLGLGSKLIANAMAFVRERNYQRVYLTTFQGLDAARHLYEKAGFVLSSENEAATWGRTVTEQRFDWYADENS
jgi:GNAT superfamily N-acetyltransferase